MSKVTERKVKEHFTESSEEYSPRKRFPEHDLITPNSIKDRYTRNSNFKVLGAYNLITEQKVGRRKFFKINLGDYS